MCILLRSYFKILKIINLANEKLVQACKEESPFQVVPENKITQISDQDFKEHFYYDQREKLCKRFYSKVPEKYERSKNIFESVEVCASYCPASNQKI